jgi:hypothetical protein
MAATKGLVNPHHNDYPAAESEVCVWVLIVVLLALSLFATASLFIKVAG